MWPKRIMYRLLGMSTSCFYDWLNRPMSQHERKNAQLLKAIKHSHETNDGTYGSLRVARDFMDAGFACSENRVASLMKIAGTKARHKRRRTPGQLRPQCARLRGICWTGSFKQVGRIKSGQSTLLMSGQVKAGCLLQSFSICIRGVPWAGRCSRR